MLTGGKQKVKKGIDKTSLEQMVQVAKERMDSQNAWNALTVKVPAFSPWAPNGYARLLTQVEAAEKVLKKSKKELTQDEINAAASALNVSINTMRPGNLAEPEDLKNLMTLLQQAANTSNKTTQLREAIDYANMVVQYVNEGSGTRDLIEKATNKLLEAQTTIER